MKSFRFSLAPTPEKPRRFIATDLESGEATAGNADVAGLTMDAGYCMGVVNRKDDGTRSITVFPGTEAQDLVKFFTMRKQLVDLGAINGGQTLWNSVFGNPQAQPKPAPKQNDPSVSDLPF